MRRILALAPLLASLLAAAPAQGAPFMLGRHGDPEPGRLTVMTRNLYLGADINRIAAAQTPQDIPVIAGELWATAQLTDFAARAKVIAAEIAAARPDVVALEEASLFRTGPGYACVAMDVPATTVALDFLSILEAALAERGLDYALAASLENFDAQLCAATASGFIDVRLTDRDAILVRRGLQVRNVATGHYAAMAGYPAAGATLPVKRGWLSAEVRAPGGWVTVAATHLEQELFAAVQQAQAAELAAVLASARAPVVLAGDLNAGPELAAVTTSYADLLRAGYADPWPRLHRTSAPTCCYDEALLTGSLSTRIDHVLWRGHLAPVAAWRIGVNDRTPSGLHASDHAGLVVEFKPGFSFGRW